MLSYCPPSHLSPWEEMGSCSLAGVNAGLPLALGWGQSCQNGMAAVLECWEANGKVHYVQYSLEQKEWNRNTASKRGRREPASSGWERARMSPRRIYPRCSSSVLRVIFNLNPHPSNTREPAPHPATCPCPEDIANP